jgi:hypothetical protein
MKTANFNVNWKYLKNKKDEKIGVVCTIQGNNSKEIISSGQSKCMKCDEFSKEFGFKLSLQRALYYNFVTKKYIEVYSKIDRTEIWEGFRNLSPKKPKWNIKIKK